MSMQPGVRSSSPGASSSIPNASMRAEASSPRAIRSTRAGVNLIESVLMRYPTRTTLCISSQVGCGMGCPFCGRPPAKDDPQRRQNHRAGKRLYRRTRYARRTAPQSGIVSQTMDDPGKDDRVETLKVSSPLPRGTGGA